MYSGRGTEIARAVRESTDKRQKDHRQTIKRIKELKLDASYRLAQKCNVMVSWHKMSIQGQRVVLGEASIILPDCTIVGFEKLKEIELNYKG